VHIRLDVSTEQKLAHFAKIMGTNKSDIVKPYIYRMLEDMGDYIHAMQALEDEGSVSLDDLEKDYVDVED